MTAVLEDIFNDIEHQRKELIASLMKVSRERMNAHPAGKWSVNQVIAHLISGERLSLQYVQKKIHAIDQVGNAGVTEKMKMWVLIVSQRLPLVKFKAPKIVVEQTRDSESFEELVTEWDRIRADWVILLNRIPEGGENKLIYKHVVAGRLGLKHALLFMREHIIHHQRQIRRLLGNG